jgi:hypothetical protein
MSGRGRNCRLDCRRWAELAVVVQDHVEGQIVGRLGRGTNETGTPTQRAFSPWSSMSYSNRANDLKMPP